MKCGRKTQSEAKFRVKTTDNTFIERVDAELSIPDDFHWKLLSTYVDDLKGYLLEEDVSSLHTIIRMRDFTAYLELSEVWGLKNINTQGAMSEFSLWKARYHIASLLKKLNIEHEEFDKRENALEKFMSAEKKV